MANRLTQQVKKEIPHDIGVQGSYQLGNIGDRALGEQFRNQLQRDGTRVRTFDRKVTSSNSPNRVLGGGGVIHDWYGHEHLERRLAYVNSGDRGFVIGVGVPGCRSPEARALVSEVLPQMDLVTVRDQWSKNNVESICDADVTVTACPAFLYTDPGCEETNKTGINFRPYFGQEDKPDSVLKQYFGYEHLDGSKEAYIENASDICESVDDPVFIPFHPNDQKFAEEHLDIPVLSYTPSVGETLERVSKMEKMVTMRYHSLIFAAVCGKPVLSLGYEPKVESVAERLGVPTYKPHGEIATHFTPVSNVASLRSSAKANFDTMRTLIE